jgi:ubiquinone biosynthesis protein UbiJ
MLPETPFAAALNHLLGSQEWARARLAPFAGETVELRGPPLPALRFTILPGGRVQAGGAEPALVVTLRPEALVALTKGEEHLMRSVEVSGNARLASEVLQLVRHLRWEAEEDLSRVVGDVAAHRLVQAARGFAAWQADSARRFGETLADYFAEEKRVLMRRGEFSQLSAAVGELRDALERLDKRVRRLG